MNTFLKALITNSPNQLITYAEYMGAALYHPEFGYYMKNKQKIGREGDFITTSNISDLYGRMMAKWFSHICEKFHLSPVFCEVGAGNGRFARAFLQEWKESIQTPIKYIIVESSPYHHKLQQELLGADFSFFQVESLNEVGAFEGMVFSNELFDALPVHVIEKQNGVLYEIMIGIREDELYEQMVPLTNSDIQFFLQESQIELKEKQRIEVPLALKEMVRDFSRTLTKGMVVTVDYGYTNEEWMHPGRSKGSLRGYYQHQQVDDVLQHPGEMDITTHIHFDYLIQIGQQEDLDLLTKHRQDEFLLKVGILKELENHYDPNPFSEVSKRNRAIRSLIMPSGMSSFFHVVIQQKGLQFNANDIFAE
ncbi:class I SAM-dependent methyltransferase [Neobacillus drentensis]|uniref:class I SAM-dependent methyltransferase n=1 Tax=Neobacillus drentensis TaxID=220684 RepID=UPI002FFE28B1